jgi:hypothetical protein
VPPDRVARLTDALEHLSMRAQREALATSGELTAPRERVREALVVAIDEAADDLDGRATGLLRGTGSPAEVRAGVEELSDLLDLLDTVQG